MKTREQKTKRKGQESTIGKIIYGFLLFSPLIAILTGCLISTFNMASKEETEIHYKYETNEVNSENDLIVGNTYYLNYTFNVSDTTQQSYPVLVEDDTGTNIFYINDIAINKNLINAYIFSYYFDFAQINTLISPSQSVIFTADDLHDIGFELTRNDTTINTFEVGIILTYLSTDTTINPNLINLGYFKSLPLELNIIDYVETHNVSAEDVFYRSVNKVVQSPLFNWAQNSIIYTTTASTCNALSITTPFIPLLLSYWLIISVMYFLYDIALMLVWILHRKIHELQDSI